MQFWCDDLYRLAVGDCKGRAQCFMTAHDLIQALLQCRDVETPLELNCYRDVISRATGFKLIEKPEPLLCEGEGNCAVTHGALDGRCRHTLRVGNACGQGRDGRCFEQFAQ